MIKYSLLFIIALFTFFSFGEGGFFDQSWWVSVIYAIGDEEEEEQEDEPTNPCIYSESWSISQFLQGCRPDGVVSWWNMSLENGLRNTINRWITNFSLFLWFIAVWALVYAGLLLQFSGWEDEKISKAKNILKWAIIGFILLISASGIVYVIINVMFGLWWN